MTNEGQQTWLPGSVRSAWVPLKAAIIPIFMQTQLKSPLGTERLAVAPPSFYSRQIFPDIAGSLDTLYTILPVDSAHQTVTLKPCGQPSPLNQDPPKSLPTASRPRANPLGAHHQAERGRSRRLRLPADRALGLSPSDVSVPHLA